MVVTIYDIAQRAGLSKSTVAGVLSQRSGFSEQTRVRVRSLARQMGYRPSPLGRALVGGRTMSLGLIIGSTDPLHVAGISPVDQAASAAGYRLFVLFARGDLKQYATAVQDLLDRRVDGLIVYGFKPPPPAVQAVLDRAGDFRVPVVYMREGPAENAPRQMYAVVRVQRDRALRQLAAHLHSWGHRKVVHVRTELGDEPTPPTLTAYERAFAAEGLDFSSGGLWTMRPQSLDPADWIDAAYELVRSRLAAGDVPTCITVADDELAIVVMSAIQDAGLRVPQDISVVGKDGHPMAHLTRPGLTTITEPVRGPAEAAYKLLSTLMTESHTPLEPPVFEAELVLRASTGPARAYKVGE